MTGGGLHTGPIKVEGARNTRISIVIPGGWIATDEAYQILTEQIPVFLELFLGKNRKYAGLEGNVLGPKGKFVDLFRKTMLLKSRLWDGSQSLGEDNHEVLRDIIGHCFLMLQEMDLKGPQDDEDTEPEEDPEVASLMRWEQANGEPVHGQITFTPRLNSRAQEWPYATGLIRPRDIDPVLRAIPYPPTAHFTLHPSGRIIQHVDPLFPVTSVPNRLDIRYVDGIEPSKEEEPRPLNPITGKPLGRTRDYGRLS